MASGGERPPSVLRASFGPHEVERFPVIIYVGAGVLAWTAAKMITAEPFLKDYFAGHPAAAVD